MGIQHVLIVDDRPTNQNIFAKLTSALDPEIEVKTCGDPREALALLDDWIPDLIIADYSMPEMNGAEFTREVRRRPAQHDVPIVVITAYDDREFRLSALEAGATDFLQSPVDRREFQARARALLAFRRQQLTVQSRAAEYETQARSTALAAELFGQASGTILAQMLDGIPVMIAATDRAGRCLFVNAHQAAISRRAPSELVGTSIADMFGAERGRRDREADARVLATGGAIPAYEEEVEHDGVRLVYLTNKAPLRDGAGEIIGVLTSAVDITGRKRAETHLHHMARHDVLTGLPNRILFRDRLHAAIIEAQRSGGRVAVYLLDLDRFKFVNDTRGHRAGDRVLETVAATINAMVAPDECAARLGGDEFAVLALVGTAEEAGQRAQAFLAALDRTYALDGQDVVLSGSLGIALSPDHSLAPDELLRTADLAMYAAKAAGGNTFRFYHAELSHAAQVAVRLEAELHGAIERDEFELFYQPVTHARTGDIVGAEALLRWNHPSRGRLGPGDFLRCAEETGMIIPIGEWVLRDACRQLARWQAGRLPLPRIAVNLSALQFQRTDVFALVRDAVTATGIPPGALELELVESLLVSNREAAADTLQRLRDFGVRIAVDDFGTGYSSLQYLRDLPVDRLKIDRSFVMNLPFAAKDAAIVHAITSMARDLGLETTAEGVETEEQSVMLRAIGCDHLQGYHIGRPQPAAAFEHLIRIEPIAPYGRA